MTPDQAKEHLRSVAASRGVFVWVGDHPWEGVAAAFLTGLVVSSTAGGRGLLKRGVAALMKLV